jgi:hypothetical protein
MIELAVQAGGWLVREQMQRNTFGLRATEPLAPGVPGRMADAVGAAGIGDGLGEEFDPAGNVRVPVGTPSASTASAAEDSDTRSSWN